MLVNGVTGECVMHVLAQAKGDVLHDVSSGIADLRFKFGSNL
jgi:hypothetical protein